MKLKRIITAVVAAALLTVPTMASAKEPSKEYETYNNILDFIEKSYIDETYTKDVVLKNAIDNYLRENPQRMIELLKSTFDELDDYSEFFTFSELQAFMDNVNNVSYGIGVVIQEKDGYVVITECLEDGGAVKAGIQPGDKIIKVDGKDVIGLSMDVVRSYVVGERLTDVTVTVLRADKEYEYKITRDSVKNVTVSSTILDGNIGYISVSTFADTTALEFAEALDKMSESGVKKIMLDLRDNGGGVTDAAINMAKMIVPEGVIITLEHRLEEKSVVYKSDLKETEFEFVVLVNENTASASEILASAIQESGAGVLVGGNTYGKAVAQEVFVLADAYGGVKLTTAHYLTRNGNEINGIGLEPDEFVLNEVRKVDTTKYTPFEYNKKYQIGEKGQSVRAAEERLSKIGYSVGNVDDEYTEETQNAVYRFQEENGLYPYGVLDITTQVKINNVFYEMTELVDKQFDRAYELAGGVTEEK